MKFLLKYAKIVILGMCNIETIMRMLGSSQIKPNDSESWSKFSGISEEMQVSDLSLSVFHSVASEICVKVEGISDEKTPKS